MNIRRYSASGVFYGEQIYSGSMRQCLEYLAEVFERRLESGWELTRSLMRFELTHDDKADVHTFIIERGAE